MPNVHRLLMLADLCEEFHYGTAELVKTKGYDPPNRFYMGSWYQEISSKKGRTIFGCVLGTAIFSPKFQAEGLLLYQKTQDEDFPVTPRYESSLGFAAGEKFLQIPHNVSLKLFSPRSNEDARYDALLMANKIRLYVKSLSPAAYDEHTPLPVDTRKLPSFALPVSMVCAVLVATLIR